MSSALRTYSRLLLNHIDAWQVALTVSTLALLLHTAVSAETVLLLLAIGVGYWFGFAINDFYDAPVDAADPQKKGRNFFTMRRLPRWALALGTTAVLLFLTAVFAQFGWLGVLLLGVSIFVMWAYSAPPLRLKEQPGIDLLLHASFVQTYPYMLVLWLTGVRWTVVDVVILLILTLASLTAQIEQQARDMETDRQYGRNFVISIGYQRALWVLRLLTGVMLFIAVYFVITGLFPWFVVPFGLIALPAMVHRFTRADDETRSERLVVLSTTTGLLYMGAVFLYFLLVSPS